MDSHLFGGKHNMNKLSTTVAAVYTFIAVASLGSQSISAAAPGTVTETRRNSGFADVVRKSGQELVGGEFKMLSRQRGRRLGFTVISPPYEPPTSDPGENDPPSTTEPPPKNG